MTSPPPHLPRLLERLRQLEGPVVQVWGWPGTGKRALLADWEAEQGEEAAGPAAEERAVLAVRRRRLDLDGPVLGPGELLLTVPEVASLARGAPAEDETAAAVLAAATDGWLEPLRRILASGAPPDPTPEALIELPGVSDFLRREVFEPLPADLRDLLLEVAGGPDLEADLWREVWGEQDGRIARLGRLLAEEGLWVEEGGRRRLPRLLGRFLESERRRAWPAGRALAAGQRLALAAYGRGRLADALEALATAGDRVRLSRLLEVDALEVLTSVPVVRLRPVLTAAGPGAGATVLSEILDALGAGEAGPGPAAGREPAGDGSSIAARVLEIGARRRGADAGAAVSRPPVAAGTPAGRTAVRARLLGRPEVFRWGPQGPREVRWTLKRAFKIFAFLACSPGREASREELVEAVWPDEREEVVERNFHPTLSHLRRSLSGEGAGGPPVLPFKGGTYRLGPDLDWSIDAAELLERIAAGRARLEAGDREGAAAAWRAAWGLYRGPFLEGFYDAWAEERREDLARAYVDALRLLGDLLFDQGDLAGALDAYRAALVADPLQERVHVAVMRIYAQQARRDLVRRQYERLSDLLQEELGVEPLAETSDEFQRLMG